ncbi:sulfurtransferase TusA family protein [Alteribacter populi]|uniref:sulfurtransferase TusA family protein n=1 Tax=Alteribacter populi TaxID=2011011 RepID=UPI000BBB302B|nr:sulfurtransferase TusA family protein [Alteribacter populi]
MIKTDRVLDAKGLACPSPIVRTKKVMQDLSPGQVLEVLATDKGSTADLQAWAKSGGHEYIGTTNEGEVLKHYLRKACSYEEKQETKHPHVIDNDGLKKKLDEGNAVVVDVREQAEYSFNHIPGSLSLPLGELEYRLNDLKKGDEIYVVCYTGNRSDMAAKKLVESGFTNVINVVPGMSDWSGPTEKNF